MEDGTITQVGRQSQTAPDATETVDADGSVLCPGFIDTHSHSDLEVFADPVLEPKVRQGITTEIVGQDGFSAGPLSRDKTGEWEDHLSGMNGRLDDDWEWGCLGAYLDAIEANSCGPNVATLVGHGTVRYETLGMTDREPTPAELEEMAALVAGALEDGAIGFSTGLVYPPQVHATTGEVRRLARELAAFDRPFVAHIRNESVDIWEALEEFIRIGSRESIPLHLSHFKLAFAPQHGKARRAIGVLKSARERGVDITADQYPYTAGSTKLGEVLPAWVHADGPEGVIESLQTEADRARIRAHLEARLDDWDRVVVTSVASTRNQAAIGETIAAIARERGTTPETAIMDLLVEERLEVGKITYMLHEDDVRSILQYGGACIATDGLLGGNPHPRTYGTYPRVLGHYVRDENLLPLEAAVQMMTALPARAMGMQTKGLVRPGMDADLLVFDPVAVRSNATFEQPRQYPDGIEHVLVNGSFVVREEAITGSLPGSVIRA
ncbi:amidohydrolase family protein [Haloarcula sp. S1CR25-12]|uniref:Amidohydrolase family protein n=1 Tax=Haloarcula saliterrae TaxID=2950534 RepID=A0ABU2FGR5_9EURY|nr:amidohydrolase family protein [Haloarcula sp. S1CR25-12]MDS0261138.1 amidohydrolase family protein [Haloarcula sp. S1CR25-12]